MRYLAIIILLSQCVCAVAATSFDAPIKNAGFEEVAEGNEAPHWAWWRMSDASFRGDTTNPHSGSRCLLFTSNSEQAPEVYSRFVQGVPVLPGTEYELTVWVRGVDVGPGIHFTDWKSFTMSLPPGVYNWQKISMVFTTRQDQTGIDLGLNVTNRCKELAIDDISLRPTGIPFKGEGITGSYLIPGRVNNDNSKTNLVVFLTSSLQGPATVEAKIMAGKETLFEKSDAVKPGENTFQWEWSSGATLEPNLELSLRVVAGGKVVAQAARTIEKMSPAILNTALDRVESRKNGEFARLYAQCQSRKIPLDYPATAKTALEQFIPLTREDIKKGDFAVAGNELIDLNRILDESIAEMKFYLANPRLAPNAVRYKTGKVDIDGISFIGDRVDSRGKTSRGPLFFNGYGHFGQITRDMPRWPGYGVNIVQYSNFGPSAVLVSEDKVDLAPIEDLIKTLDAAAKNNVKVDVLLSAHYFPAWALQKWPQLTTAGGGFINYCVDLPEAKQVLEKFIRIIVPMIKDHPALHSFCLTNEPTFVHTTGAPNTRPMYTDYLTRTHGDIATLNARYGASYKSFDEVPMGGGFDDPAYYDYCMFNKHRFANWHKWMADLIHEMAPNVPTHAKICMVLELPGRQNSTWGVDPELFGAATEINGNDCYFQYVNEGGWASGWHLQNMVYDLQRSLNRTPIFNSENHPSRDGSNNYIPQEHFRACLWQGMIHGQGATTTWVWERAMPKGEPGWEGSQCFYGNVMYRPGAALEVGRTTLDLNRFADEVTALQLKSAPVAVVYSKASFMKNAGYIDAMNRSYEALNFCGVKIDFISEDQLAAGKGKSYRMIVLPQCTHLTDGAVRGLLSLPASVRLVALGDTPAKTPWGKDLPADQVTAAKQRIKSIDPKLDAIALWPLMHAELADTKALPSVSVVDAKAGRPVWGVEWLPSMVGKRTVVNLINWTNRPVDVKLVSGGKDVKASDLLSFGGQSPVRTLKPLIPVLAEVNR